MHYNTEPEGRQLFNSPNSTNGEEAVFDTAVYKGIKELWKPLVCHKVMSTWSLLNISLFFIVDHSVGSEKISPNPSHHISD